jgi:hypothetical protein
MDYVKEDWKSNIPVDMEVAQVLRELWNKLDYKKVQWV